ncbi:hypothetical protein HYV89_04305 [Candidatus Woesearchaeota archaeon]|nr:hypothetical protein [Candidatus Woesearchaeota archaeon]
MVDSIICNSIKNLELKEGRGTAIAHHGEILQGMFEDAGKLFRGSVTLPCHIFGSQASFFPKKNSSKIVVDPEWKIKSKKAAELTLKSLGVEDIGGRLMIKSNTPLRLGLGSSTSDVNASILSVANSLGVVLSPVTIASIAVKAEIATDAIIFGERAVLFGHRDGKVFEDLGGNFPPMEVLGFNSDPDGEGVDTLAFPPAEYSWQEIEMLRPLVGLMRRAIYEQNPKLIGRVSIASTEINQRFLPTKNFDSIKNIVRKVNAAGLQASHSGIVVGIIFDSNDVDKEQKIHRSLSLLKDIGYDNVWRFRTDKLHLEAGL